MTPGFGRVSVRAEVKSGRAEVKSGRAEVKFSML